MSEDIYDYGDYFTDSGGGLYDGLGAYLDDEGYGGLGSFLDDENYYGLGVGSGEGQYVFDRTPSFPMNAQAGQTIGGLTLGHDGQWYSQDSGGNWFRSGSAPQMTGGGSSGGLGGLLGGLGNLLGNSGGVLGSGMKGADLVALLGGLGAGGIGAAGIAELLSGGPDRTATSNITRTLAPASEYETQAHQNAIGQYGTTGNALSSLRSNQFTVDPAQLQAMGQQVLGTMNGNLPALNDNLRGQVGKVYEGRLQDVNRYVDTGLRDALDRARQMGFAGGMEVFREGAPGALVDRTMAEAVRQRGALAGQQAQSELDLAQSLPLLGANLANTQANIGFAQNQSGANLVNLNRQLAESLGNYANNMGNQRLGTATINQTSQGPARGIIDAFQPASQLLGGFGGLLSGLYGTGNQNQRTTY